MDDVFDRFLKILVSIIIIETVVLGALLLFLIIKFGIIAAA